MNYSLLLRKHSLLHFMAWHSFHHKSFFTRFLYTFFTTGRGKEKTTLEIIFVASSSKEAAARALLSPRGPWGRSPRSGCGSSNACHQHQYMPEFKRPISGLSKQKESKQIWKTSRRQKGVLYVRMAVEKIPEFEFVNLVRSPGIDSQPDEPVRRPYLTYRTASGRLHRLAESLQSVPVMLGSCLQTRALK
jgi:hypothetical protein